MEIEEDTIVFKSEPYYFKEERDGLKPNTVRLLTHDEMEQLRPNGESFEITHIKKIRIQNTLGSNFETHPNSKSFTRTLTSIEQIGELCGYYLFVFSWRHEEKGIEQ